MRHLEREQQTLFFRWTELIKYNGIKLRNYCYSVPNELPFSGKKAMLAMLNLRAAGLTKGVFDIECMIPMAPYTGLHIEMKAPKPAKSKVSDEQKEIRKMLELCKRKCCICYSFEEAKAAMLAYLAGKP